jgi:hypothetical protein
MSMYKPTEKELLKTILRPLLEDFGYWFTRSLSLLELEDIDFLSPAQQQDLLNRVKAAQKEVQATRMLFEAMDGQAGIEPATLFRWHNLVTECWQVARQWRCQRMQLGS